MPRLPNALLVAATLGLAATSPGFAQNADARPDTMYAAMGSSLTWAPIEVPGFPTGLKIAVIQGNPQEAGLYTLRLSLPDGYAFPAHWHPNTENLTVISGTFMLAMGDRVDNAKLKTYQPGDFLFLPGTMPHFGKVQGATVVQLHGPGPFAINVVQAPTR